MDSSTIEAISQQVQIMEPQVFASNMPANLAAKLPNLASLVAGTQSSHSASHITGVNLL
jgi:hypothetical protein